MHAHMWPRHLFGTGFLFLIFKLSTRHLFEQRCLFGPSICTVKYGVYLQGRMYQDPQRWSYLFQSKVFLSMMDIHHKKSVSLIQLNIQH